MTTAAGRSSGPVASAELPGPVLVVGAGLIGTSVGLALRRRGIKAYLRDRDPTAARIAASRGAGSDGPLPRAPRLVVVATPPDSLGGEIGAALSAFPAAAVTDVGSVKTRQLEELRAQGIASSRYVGGHPMAGSERSGPLAAAPDLFDGRAWAVVTREDCDLDAVAMVTSLVAACGAVVVPMDSAQHDLAVARISHLPHVAAALVASQLVQAPAEHLALSGSGVRDVTRIAAGDPSLWRQILTSNAAAVTGLLSQLRDDVDALLEALHAGNAERVQQVLEAGAAGAAAIPGKHGGPKDPLVGITIAIPDAPGTLARLFADVGAAGVNIEDVRIDHDPARSSGHVELDVTASAAVRLVAALTERGWTASR